MDRKIIRIVCVPLFIIGILITVFGWRHFQQTGQPPGRAYDFGPFAIVFGLGFFAFPDRFDDRRFGWIVVIIAAIIMMGYDFLLRSY